MVLACCWPGGWSRRAARSSRWCSRIRCPGESLPDYVSYNWDSHAVNCHIFNDARLRFPLYDQAVTALIEDLYQRGLDRRVLLVVTGEFGRTPRLSYSMGTASHVMQPGRDHWPNAMSMIVSGGGMRTGQVIGATNAKGEFPTERPLSPNDLWATVLKHLGIDPQRAFNDFAGRPVPILALRRSDPRIAAGELKPCGTRQRRRARVALASAVGQCERAQGEAVPKKRRRSAG